MRNVSFAHIKDFRHRHFAESRHDFQTQNSDGFLGLVASDLAGEASEQAAAKTYIKKHPQPARYEPKSVAGFQADHNNRRLSQHEKRQQRLQAMPKHMYIDDQYRSGSDSGMVFAVLQDLMYVRS